jgi:hypothetical protein
MHIYLEVACGAKRDRERKWAAKAYPEEVISGQGVRGVRFPRPLLQVLINHSDIYRALLVVLRTHTRKTVSARRQSPKSPNSFNPPAQAKVSAKGNFFTFIQRGEKKTL